MSVELKDRQVNQLLQKLALSRLQEYQKEGDHIFGSVYNDKGQQVNVADQFEYMLSYYQVLPKDLPDFNKYISIIRTQKCRAYITRFAGNV